MFAKFRRERPRVRRDVMTEWSGGRAECPTRTSARANDAGAGIRIEARDAGKAKMQAASFDAVFCESVSRAVPANAGPARPSKIGRKAQGLIKRDDGKAT